MDDPVIADDDPDPEIEEFKRRRRRAIAVRFGLAGFLTAAGGVVTLLYGRHLNVQQAGSAVHYALPDQLELAGFGALVVGAALLVAAGIVALRALHDARRVRIPPARLRS